MTEVAYCICRSGQISNGGKIDFTSINALTANPNPYDNSTAAISGGGLGLLPWYLHPPVANTTADSTGASGQTSSDPPSASGPTPGAPGASSEDLSSAPPPSNAVGGEAP